MRKFLMATSALLLLGGVPAFAQGTDPGTDQFEPSNQSDEPTPDIVDPGTADAGAYRVWRPLAEGDSVAAGDCVQMRAQTGEFQPSDQNDQPTPDAVQTDCPTGMLPADSVLTGSVGEPLREGVPGTEMFEPSDQNDEQVPDVQD